MRYSDARCNARSCRQVGACRATFGRVFRNRVLAPAVVVDVASGRA